MWEVWRAPPMVLYTIKHHEKATEGQHHPKLEGHWRSPNIWIPATSVKMSIQSLKKD